MDQNAVICSYFIAFLLTFLLVIFNCLFNCCLLLLQSLYLFAHCYFVSYILNLFYFCLLHFFGGCVMYVMRLKYWLCLKYDTLSALYRVHIFAYFIVLFYKIFVFTFRFLSNVVKICFRICIFIVYFVIYGKVSIDILSSIHCSLK